MTPIYQFGPFRLDPAERLLLRDGQPVPITPKAFDLLVYLVEHHGRLVEKATLMAALWPDTIVEEANLAFQISALRKVLEDGGNGDSLIQTVPTRGYRFVGAVTLSHAASRGSSSARWRDRRCGAGRRRGGRPRTNLEANDSGRSRFARRAGWHRGCDLLGTAIDEFAAGDPRARCHATDRKPEGASDYICADLARWTLPRLRGSHRYPRAVHRHGRDPPFPDTRGMAIYGWSRDSTTVRASACDTEMCVGWDIALVGGTRRRSGASWSVNEEVKAAPDGSRLLRIVDLRELRVDLLNGTHSRLLLRSAELIGGAAWSVDGARIFYIPALDGSAVRTLPVNGGVPVTVFTVRKNEAIADVVELASQRLVVAIERADPSTLARSPTQVSIQEVRTNSAGVAVGRLTRPDRVAAGPARSPQCIQRRSATRVSQQPR